MLPLLAQLPPAPATDSPGLWGLYALVFVLAAAVAALWHADRTDRKGREKRDIEAEQARLAAAKADAASRTELADAVRGFSEQIRGCPAARNGTRAAAAGGLREVPP